MAPTGPHRLVNPTTDPLPWEHGLDTTLLEMRNGIPIDRRAGPFRGLPDLPFGPESLPQLRQL
jgi:hypothetical protein